MGLGDWISTASNLANGNILDSKLLDKALSGKSPALKIGGKIGGKIVDQLIDKMSSKSGSFGKVFNKAQQKLGNNGQNNAQNAHFVRQLPAVKPGAYGPMTKGLTSGLAAGMIPNATAPTEAWARLEQFDTNNDQQLDNAELDNALDTLSRQEAEQISHGASPADIQQTQALRKFANGLQHYQQTIASFDQHQDGISAADLTQLASLSGNETKITIGDWKTLDA